MKTVAPEGGARQPAMRSGVVAASASWGDSLGVGKAACIAAQVARCVRGHQRPIMRGNKGSDADAVEIAKDLHDLARAFFVQVCGRLVAVQYSRPIDHGPGNGYPLPPAPRT